MARRIIALTLVAGWLLVPLFGQWPTERKTGLLPPDAPELYRAFLHFHDGLSAVGRKPGTASSNTFRLVAMLHSPGASHTFAGADRGQGVYEPNDGLLIALRQRGDHLESLPRPPSFAVVVDALDLGNRAGQTESTHWKTRKASPPTPSREATCKSQGQTAPSPWRK